jgi:DNA-binding IclR family transcriptional regulator
MIPDLAEGGFSPVHGEADRTPETEAPAGSQSLLRGLQIIEILSNFPNGCPLAKLADVAELNKSTTHRLLQGLESAGYVTRAPSPGSYRLTTKFVAIGQKTLSSLNIIHVAAPHLEALNLDIGETVNFSAREDDHATLIYKLEPTTGMMRTRAYIGQHLPLYSSAMGKLFLAYSKRSEFLKYWEKNENRFICFTRNTITDLAAMEIELERIRSCGKSVDREENELGVTCVAAPVFDIYNRVQYAVSVSLSTAKLDGIGEDNLVEPIREAASRICRELGSG